MKPYIIYGKHAVSAAIKNPQRQIETIYCPPNQVKDFQSTSKIKNIISLDKNGFKKLLPNTQAQDIAALVQPVKLSSIPQNLSKIVILDKVTDPQNLGSILRSAAAFGVDAVLYPKDGAVSENGVVAKAASGALDIVPLVEITNISNIVKDLKKEDFWIIGTDGSATETLGNNQKLFDSKIAVIMGSEGKGLRDLVKKNCDMLVKIPIKAQMESLNVSIAASIIMYEMTRNTSS